MFGFSTRDNIDKMLMNLYNEDLPKYKMDFYRYISKDMERGYGDKWVIKTAYTIVCVKSLRRITDALLYTMKNVPNKLVRKRFYYAIWNSIDVGGTDLSYFADAITSSFAGGNFFIPSDMYLFSYYAFTGNNGEKGNAIRHNRMYHSQFFPNVFIF